MENNLSNAVHNHRNKSLLYWIIFALLGIAAATMVLWGTQNYGVSVSPDGKTYLYYAQELAKGNRIELTVFPLLYPAILAVVSAVFKIEPLSAARFINCSLFGLTVFFSGVLYKRYLDSTLVFLGLALVSIMLAIPLLPVFIGVYSEPLFIFLVLISLISLDSYLHKGNLRQLVIGGLALGLACLTRYAGIIFIFSWALCSLLFSNFTLKKRLANIILLGALSSLPLMILLLRNFLISGVFAGTRYTSSYSYMDNIRSMVLSLVKWLIPGQALENGYVLFPFFFVLGFGVALYYKEVWQKDRPSFFCYYPFAIWIIAYLLFLVINARTSFLQLIDDRYLSPIFIPINLLLLAGFRELFKPIRLHRGKLWAEALLCLIFTTWLIYPLSRAGIKLGNMRAEGEGYTNQFWRENATLQYIVENFPDSTVYSNNYHVIIFYTGQLAYESPLKSQGAVEIETFETLQENWPPQDRVCLVWFDHIDRDYYFTPEEILSFTSLDSVVELPDGTIYYLSRNREQ